MTDPTSQDRSALGVRLGRLVVLAIQLGLAVGAVTLAVQTWRATAAWQAAGGFARVIDASEGPIIQPHPTVGWVHRPGAVMTYTEGVTWAIEARGLRSDEGRTEPLATPEGRRRIALVGDSFVFGNVPWADTLGERLASRLENTDVLNMGVSGYGVGQMLAFWDTFGSDWDSDLVILAFIEHDLLRSLHPRAPQGYGRPLYQPTPEGGVQATNTPLPEPLAIGRSTVPRLAWLRFVATWIVRGQAEHPYAWTHEYDTPFAILRAFVDRVRATGRDVLIVHLPREFGRASADFGLDAMCAEHGLPCLDLHGPMHDRVDDADFPDLFLPDNHYNRRGNDVAADVLATHLIREGLVSPR